MTDVSSFADKMYCINLDTRKDRWEVVSGEFKRVGIAESVQRFSGIVAEDPRIGCLRSHLECIKDAMEHDYENILIMEDDVCFYDVERSVLNDVAAFMKNNEKWELFYLGGMVMYPARFVTRHVFKSRFFSTHAYLIHQRAYRKILDAKPPIDIWYATNMISYGLNPIYVVQSESYSDIRKRVIVGRQDGFSKRYAALVTPNILTRWKNYIYLHYLRNYFPFNKRIGK